MRCESIYHRRARPESASLLARIVCLGTCVIPLVFAGGCADSENGSQGSEFSEEPVAVEVITVSPQSVTHAVALTGQFEAENQVLIKPEVNGVIATVEFEEGQPVVEGQILFQIRDGEQAARLEAARAALRLAKDVYDRTQRLAQRDVSSVARRAEVSARLDEAQARVDLAEVEFEQTRIRAPFSGMTGIRTTALGDRVEEDDALVSLAAIDRLQLVFTVQEMGVALARVGGTIHARVVPWPGERFPGRVFFVSPTIDPTARRLVLKAWVENADHRLKPGMFANVDVEVAQLENALMIPESALVHDRNGTFVWKVGAEERVAKVPVDIGLRQKGRVQVVRGVQPGDRVISAGTNKVLAGDVVSAVKAEPAAHAADETLPEASGPSGDET